MILDLSIILFMVMESANVAILYFVPDSRLGNGVAVFNFWHECKDDENAKLFASYMTNWVAGVKLIFIVLLGVILFVGNEATKVYAVAVMILSIATYFWRLSPIMKKLDSKKQITPVGYSRALDLMIAGFMTMFALSLVFYFL